MQVDRALEMHVCERLHKRCADPTVTPKMPRRTRERYENAVEPRTNAAVNT